MGARGKQAQLAQANGSKFNLLLMLVAQMSTHPRVIAACYCCWGSTKFKPTHGAPTAFEEVGVAVGERITLVWSLTEPQCGLDLTSLSRLFGATAAIITRHE